MAHYIQCDGCGAEEAFEYPTTSPKLITYVPIVVGSEPCAGFHLCAPCIDRLSESANPKKWQRENARSQAAD